MPRTGSIGAVIPAAGRGRRFRSRSGKLFEPVAGAPLLAQTLRALQQVEAIRWIVVVARERDHAAMRRLIKRYRLSRVSAIVPGGATRAESVCRGIDALPAAAEWILIHDGARPCVTPALVRTSIAHAKRSGAVVCGLPASLTVKAVDEAGTVRLTLDREQLWMIQTPQLFRRDWMKQALARVHPALSRKGGVNGRLARFPDDAALLEWAGYPVRVIPGDPWNIKVTTKDDLVLAEAILKQRITGARRQSARRQ